jgi:hypothetical protein
MTFEDCQFLSVIFKKLDDDEVATLLSIIVTILEKREAK